MERLERIFDEVVRVLKEEFPKTFKSLILYGSHAKNTAHSDSDIDLLALFSEITLKNKRRLNELVLNNSLFEKLDLVSATVQDFREEKNPLYTAIKKEGKVIYGICDLTLSEKSPVDKYRDFFKKSKEIETEKVRLAERIIAENDWYCPVEICYIASKHAVQASLAIKGVGFSSKFSRLHTLCKEYFGDEIASKFLGLFNLYVRHEYGSEELSRNESLLAVKLAWQVLRLYEIVEKKEGI